MGISVKNKEQIKRIKKAGDLVFNAHEQIRKYIKPGVTTLELDNLVNDYIRSKGGIPSFFDYDGFPKNICTSINEVVIHGIPSKTKIKDGDIVGVDLGAKLNGYHADAARTYLVGNVSAEAKKLVKITEEAFFIGIEFAINGNHLHEMSKAIQNHCESQGYSMVRDFVGHGIGRKMHEDPQIPNYMPEKGGRGPKLSSGMTLAVEPMVNQGTCEVDVLPDGWTVVTLDGKLSAHYENTILVTAASPEILTMG